MRVLAMGLGWMDLLFRGGRQVHMMRSRLLLAAGFPSDALKSALNGLRLHPDCAELHYCAGRAAIAMVRYPYARVRMAYALALDPTNQLFRFGLAYTAQRCGEFDVARREYEDILSARPDDLSARLNLSLVHKSQGDFGSALDGFERVLASKPKEEKALYGAAVCAHRMRDGQKARLWAERCVKVNRTHQKAHLLLGSLAAERGEDAQATTHFRDAQHLNPDDGRPLAAIGRLEIKGNPARGRHLLREALLVPEPDTTAHFDLAQYYEKRRLLREAIAEYALYIRYHSGKRAQWARERRVRLFEKLEQEQDPQ